MGYRCLWVECNSGKCESWGASMRGMPPGIREPVVGPGGSPGLEGFRTVPDSRQRVVLAVHLARESVTPVMKVC